MGGAKVKIPFLLQCGGIYNNEEVILHITCDSSSTLMTIWIPMTFRPYMNLHIINVSFGLRLYNKFWIGDYIIHNNDVAYDDLWQDMKWNW